MVCDADLFSVKAPDAYSDVSSGIKNVIVSGKASSTNLFKKAKVQSIDPVTLD